MPCRPLFDLLEAEILTCGDSRLWENPLTRPDELDSSDLWLMMNSGQAVASSNKSITVIVTRVRGLEYD